MITKFPAFRLRAMRGALISYFVIVGASASFFRGTYVWVLYGETSDCCLKESNAHAKNVTAEEVEILHF
ncbi:MAG: hypothetical protein HW407_2255 [Bacteroidetes bacterium]|nr:hypothetical protein [Bacteroidota bacterium]